LQYEAQRRQWLELSDTDSEEGQIEIEIIDDEAIIRVHGESRALVGALKVRAEKLGEVKYWTELIGILHSHLPNLPVSSVRLWRAPAFT
jgi:hypothetical protein